MEFKVDEELVAGEKQLVPELDVYVCDSLFDSLRDKKRVEHLQLLVSLEKGKRSNHHFSSDFLEERSLFI